MPTGRPLPDPGHTMADMTVLLHAWKAGDDQAFARLVQALHGEFLRMAASRLRGHDGGTLERGDLQAATLSVAAGATIELKLTGADPFFETGFLMVNGPLHFEGRLQLSFVNGFAPAAGQRLQLLSFEGFSGLLGADQVTVAGFDASRLDFSRLSVDGSVSMTAVPEPAATPMLGAGLVLLLGLTRRRLKGR